VNTAATAALRAQARRLFDAGLAAADPATALRAAFTRQPPPVPAAGGRLIVIAVGKAAVPMITEALRLLPAEPVPLAIAVTNYENHRAVPGCEVLAAGHPVPDENGAEAARRVMLALRNARAEDRVIALISGGGSALLPAPAPGLTLAHKAAVNRALLAGGCDIAEMNLVRQQLSQLKGGGMTRLAHPAPVAAYILSDVIGDDLRVIASGPTVAPVGTASDAVRTLQSRGLWTSLPTAVQDHLTRRMAEPAPDPVGARNLLIGSNRLSLEAAAAAAAPEWDTHIVSDCLVGDVAAACAEVIAAAKATGGRPACLIFGGETTVTLRGTGRGGRNQELALRVAMAATGVLPPDWVFLSGGTDGRDGPTEAAGGLVDAGTLARMRRNGADPAALLANNDSHAALAASGDLLITGATGTNVADMQILLCRPSPT